MKVFKNILSVFGGLVLFFMLLSLLEEKEALTPATPNPMGIKGAAEPPITPPTPAPLLVGTVCSPALPGDDEGRTEARAQFHAWDRNGDCQITQDEHPDRMLFAESDRDEDGYLSVNEIHYEGMVTFLDNNNDDTVSKGELSAIFAGPEADAIFGLLDADMDGRISFWEFDLFQVTNDQAWGKDPPTSFTQTNALFDGDSNGDNLLSASELPLGSEALQLDKNGDGLSRSEYLERYVVALLPMFLEHFREADEDGDGELTSWELTAAGNDDAEFAMMETNGDGVVVVDELRDFILRIVTGAGSLPERTWFILMDSDRSGHVDLFEIPGEEGQEGFPYLDLDGNGVLSWEEFEVGLRPIARSDALRDGGLVYHFGTLDADRDGVLSFEETGAEKPAFVEADKDGSGSLTIGELLPKS